MGFSIQEYGRKINSWLSWYDLAGLLISVILLGIFSVVLYNRQKNERLPVSYYSSNQQNNTENLESNTKVSAIFGSKSGSTYTFSWCQGATRVLEKNKVYFASESSAIASGRHLSKLCHQ